MHDYKETPLTAESTEGEHNPAEADRLWKLLDKLAETGEGCKGYAGFAPDDGPDEPITITVQGDVCTFTYHPKLYKITCSLCGKNCRERGVIPCDRVNPIR